MKVEIRVILKTILLNIYVHINYLVAILMHRLLFSHLWTGPEITYF